MLFPHQETTRFTSGATLHRSGATLHRSGATLHKSGASLHRSGATLHRSGATLHRSGATLHRSGATLHRCLTASSGSLWLNTVNPYLSSGGQSVLLKDNTVQFSSGSCLLRCRTAEYSNCRIFPSVMKFSADL
jgi:hypothetical protein